MYMDLWKPESVLLPKNVCFTNRKDFDMAHHTHEPGSIEINYVVKGRCEYHVGEKVIAMRAGNVIVINAMILHRPVFTESDSCLTVGVLLSPSDVKPGIVTLGDMVSAYDSLDSFMRRFDDYMSLRDGRFVYPLIRNIADESKEYGNDAYAALLVNQIMVKIARIISSDDRQSVDYVAQTKSYICGNYCAIKSVDDIASAVGLNKSYLQKIFREQTGMSLWNFLNETRLQYAAEKISGTDMTVERIYESAGINSRQNFNGMFKKKYGITPSEYRAIRAHPPQF